jgi:hypothetical protein
MNLGCSPQLLGWSSPAKLANPQHVFIKIRLQYKSMKAMPEEFLNSFKGQRGSDQDALVPGKQGKNFSNPNLFNLHVT